MADESLRDRGGAMLQNIADLRKLRAEQEVLLKQLEEAALLMVQGIDPHEVKHLIYDPLLDKRKKRLAIDPPLRGIINKVRLNDGREVELKPPLTR